MKLEFMLVNKQEQEISLKRGSNIVYDIILKSQEWLIINYAMMLLFKEFISFFKKFVVGGTSFTNRHLMVLNGHDNHVTLQVISQAQKMGSNMITLPSHTSHVFQALDVSCFKPFKTTFRKG
jgi:hypothetical protein